MTYQVIYTTYHNGKYISDIIGSGESENKLDDFQINLSSWDELDSFYEKYGLIVGFNIWKFKKGRLISFFSNHLPFGDYADIKEWKTKDLNITFTVKYILKNS